MDGKKHYIKLDTKYDITVSRQLSIALVIHGIPFHRDIRTSLPKVGDIVSRIYFTLERQQPPYRSTKTKATPAYPLSLLATMGLIKGGFLRLFQTLLYALCFCCAGVIVAIYGYFLYVLSKDNLYIYKQWEAVEGLAGAAVIYTMFAVLLTCCLAGVTLFSLVGLILDLLFCGAMIAIAYFSREGASSCSGYIKTPLGNGESTDTAPGTNVSLRRACKLNTAVFAVAIIAAVLFLLTAIMQLVIARSHKNEKRNNTNDDDAYVHEKNYDHNQLGAAGYPTTQATTHEGLRPSNETGLTGSTVAAPASGAAILDRHQHKNPVDDRGFHGDHAPHVGPGAETVSRSEYRGVPGIPTQTTYANRY